VDGRVEKVYDEAVAAFDARLKLSSGSTSGSCYRFVGVINK